MDNSKKIIPGDRITAKGPFDFVPRSFIVGKVLGQEWYGDRVQAGASDCWGFDVEFTDTDGKYHHWKQNQDHGIVERKSGQYWLPVSDDGCLMPGERITIRWTDPDGNDGYALVQYEGTLPLGRAHCFRSVTYGWRYILERSLETLTQENHPYELLKPNNSTGWLRYIP